MPGKKQAEYAWLIDNYEKRFLDEVKQAGIKKSCMYLEIPTGQSGGAIRDSKAFGGPEQKYYQKEGERTCLVISLANMLYYCSSRDHATQVFNRQNSFKDTADLWFKLNKFLVKMCPQLNN